MTLFRTLLAVCLCTLWYVSNTAIYRHVAVNIYYGLFFYFICLYVFFFLNGIIRNPYIYMYILLKRSAKICANLSNGPRLLASQLKGTRIKYKSLTGCRADVV